jgi:hypothetical protein
MVEIGIVDTIPLVVEAMSVDESVDAIDRVPTPGGISSFVVEVGMGDITARDGGGYDKSVPAEGAIDVVPECGERDEPVPTEGVRYNW